MAEHLILKIFLAVLYVLHLSTASTVIEWVPGSSAIVTDLDPVGDEPDPSFPVSFMYVCRATITVSDSSGTKTAIVPGKYFDITGEAYTSFRGVTYKLTKDDVEFLSYPRGVVSWVPKEGILPSTKFVVGGFDPDMVQPVYVCRARVDPPGVKPLGVILGRYEGGVCTVEVDGVVEVSSQFEVLTVNAFGVYENVGDGALL